MKQIRDNKAELENCLQVIIKKWPVRPLRTNTYIWNDKPKLCVNAPCWSTLRANVSPLAFTFL